jgi:hypothetical protein
MDPASLEEYGRLFRANLRIVPQGGTLRVHSPCPFCAAPDWWEASLEDFGRDSDPIYCIACARSAVYRCEDGPVRIELLAGPEPPEWCSERPGFELGEDYRPRAHHLRTPPRSHPRRLGRSLPGMLMRFHAEGDLPLEERRC